MATTKEKVRERTIELINEIPELLIERLDYLLERDLIDFEKEDDNYKLPKHILVALLLKESRVQTNPYATGRDKKQIKNFDKNI